MTILAVPTAPLPTSMPIKLMIAGCDVDLAFTGAEDPLAYSAVAARLAEQLVAAGFACDPGLVRVADLMPSGRPVAMLRGAAAPVFVSLSHTAALVGAAICRGAPVGLDIVGSAAMSPALDVWFSPDELSPAAPDSHRLRQRLWSAKEAAYKAAHIDAGFRPRDVRIANPWSDGFRWRLDGPRTRVEGAGMFVEIDHHLVAIACLCGQWQADSSTEALHDRPHRKSGTRHGFEPRHRQGLRPAARRGGR